MSKRKCYTKQEQADIAAAEKELARPDITLAERVRANRILQRCTAQAKKRAEGRDKPLAAEYASKAAVKATLDERAADNPDLKGLTRAQARHVTELLEAGDEQAEVWRLTYLAEAGLVNLDQMIADERSGKVPRVPLAVPQGHQDLFPEMATAGEPITAGEQARRRLERGGRP